MNDGRMQLLHIIQGVIAVDLFLIIVFAHFFFAVIGFKALFRKKQKEDGK